jgi:hypothetical protein
MKSGMKATHTTQSLRIAVLICSVGKRLPLTAGGHKNYILLPSQLEEYRRLGRQLNDLPYSSNLAFSG